jgi:hypothetical protein
MPQTIQHPTLGPIAFPDGMSDSDIVSAIKVLETPKQTPDQEAPSRMQSLGAAAQNIPAGVGDFLAKGDTARLASGAQSLYQSIPQPQETIEMGKSMLTQGGPVAVAQRVGFAVNPYVGMVATMLGGVVGRYLESKRTGTPVTGGELAESAVLSAALPAKALSLIDKSGLSTEMQKMVAATVFGKSAQKAIDTGQYITPEEALKSAAEAVAFFKMGNKLSTGTAQSELEAVRNRSKGFIKTMSAGIDEGLMPDPSISNPRGLNKAMVGFAGQSQSQALFRKHNQLRGDAIAREELGLVNDAPLIDQVMKEKKLDLARPYEEIAKINTQAKKVLNDLNDKRSEARKAWDSFSSSKGDSKLRKEAIALSKQADAVEDKLEKIVVASGNQSLLDEFKTNRAKLAKWHIFDISLSANGGRGYNGAGLDLGIIADMNDPMRGNFTGKLKTLADFASINRNVVENTVVSNPIAEKQQGRAMLFGASGATLGHYLAPNVDIFGTQVPGWMVGAGLGSVAQGGIASGKKTAQSLLATEAYQKAFARPQFNTNVPEMLPSLLMSGGPSANLPAPPQR